MLPEITRPCMAHWTQDLRVFADSRKTIELNMMG